MSNFIKDIIRFIKLSYKICKKFLLVLFLDMLLNAFSAILIFYLVKEITLFLENILTFSLNKILYLIILLLFLNISKLFLKWKIQLYSKIYILQTEEYILNKNMKIPFYILEKVEFHDLQEKIKFSLKNQYCLENLLESLVNSIEHLTTILSVFFVLSYFSVTLCIILLIFLTLNIINKFIYNRIETDFYKNLSYTNRKFWYYSMMIFRRDDMLDIKSNSLNNLIDNKFKECNLEMMNFFIPFYKRKSKNTIISEFISFLISSFVFIYSSYKIYSGSINFSEFNISVIGMLKFTGALNGLSENLVDLVRYTQYCKYVLDFMDYEEIDFQQADYKSCTLSAKNISFKYTEEEKEVLKDISFEISSPKFITIVGENGCGKSTLIKLISGLYNLDQGELKCNKKNVYGNNISSVIFQDFKMIDGLTVRENICCSLLKTDEEKKSADKKIESILKKFSIKLPESIDLDKTLGVELDKNNIELSGGQSQFIAILRAVYKNSGILILDEPQSFLDVENENLLYGLIEKLKAEKLIFLVSHKLNAVKYSDEIWYLKDGKITEKGTHSYLYKNSKDYKILYDTQIKRYNQLD